MSSSKLIRSLRALVALGVVCAAGLGTQSARAQATLFFTGSGSTSNWDSSTSDWGTSSGGPYNTQWAQYDFADFQGTSGTVNVASGMASNGLTFDVGGYNLTGGAVQIGNPTTPFIKVLSGGTATIGSTMNGAGNNTVHIGNATGYAGTLILTGDATNLFNSHPASIDAGTLVFNYGSTSPNYTNSFSGGGIVAFIGTGQATMSGGWTGFTGTVNVNTTGAGALVFSNGSNSPTDPANFSGGGNVTFNGTGQASMSGNWVSALHCHPWRVG